MSKRKHPRSKASQQGDSTRNVPAQTTRAAIVPSLMLVMALSAVAYLNALGNGFTLDDVSLIVENPVIREPLDVRSVFTSPYWARGSFAPTTDPTLYRPLTVLTFFLDYSVWGLNATGYHVTNIALHAATTVGVFFLALQVAGGVTAAFIAASVFAVHPLHTEAVTAIVGRAEILATLCFVTALLLLRRRSAFQSSFALLRSAGAALIWLAGLFSKEIAATLPFVLMMDDWSHRSELPRDRPDRMRVLLIRYVPLLSVAILYAIVRLGAVSGTHIWLGFTNVSSIDRILTASRVLMEYLGLFLVPRTLQADYWITDVPIATSALQPAVLLSLALWSGIAATLVKFGKREPRLLIPIALFFITIAPVSNVVFPIGGAKAERFLYLPSVGLCLLVGFACAQALPLLRWRLAPRILFAAVLAGLTFRTAVRNRDWHDNLTLALATLAQSPSSPLMNDIAAAEFIKRGEPLRALPLLQEALRQIPDNSLFRTHLGTVYLARGALEQAIAEYREAIRLEPSNADAHNNLGVAYLDQQRHDEAAAAFRAAVALRPAFADAHSNLGTVHFARGELDEAESRFTEALRLNPASPEVHNNVGLVLAHRGDLERAATYYREALRLNPGFEKARLNLAKLGQPPETGRQPR